MKFVIAVLLLSISIPVLADPVQHCDGDELDRAGILEFFPRGERALELGQLQDFRVWERPYDPETGVGEWRERGASLNASTSYYNGWNRNTYTVRFGPVLSGVVSIGENRDLGMKITTPRTVLYQARDYADTISHQIGLRFVEQRIRFRGTGVRGDFSGGDREGHYRHLSTTVTLARLHEISWTATFYNTGCVALRGHNLNEQDGLEGVVVGYFQIER